MVHFPFLILSLSFDLSELPRSLQLNEIKDKKKKGTKGVGRYGALIVPTRRSDIGTAQHTLFFRSWKCRSEITISRMDRLLFVGFLSGGFFLGVFYSFTFFFFPLFLFLLLFGDPLRTRVVMTFLLTHLHSPHFVLDSFLLFLEKKTKRNQAKNGFKLPKLQCRLWGYVRASTLKLLSGPS